MSIEFSRRTAHLLQSEIRNMSLECDRMGGINLSQGICDTPVPHELRAAVGPAVEDGFNSYTRYDGLSILREALCKKLKAHNGLTVDPEREIVVSAGSTGAFYAACLALLDPQDEVILFEPYYGYHASTLRAVDAVPKVVPLRPPDWAFREEDLLSAIGPRTRAIMINTPANPCGKVWTRDELSAVGRIATRRGLTVFTDEVYEYILYDGREHVSPASVPELAGCTISMGSFSKTFAVTGWRVGWLVADAESARMIGYMNDLVYVCAPAPLQVAVAKGLSTLPESYYRGLSELYQEKRDRLCGALSAAGLEPSIPEGAYYVLADVTGVPGSGSKEKAMTLLREAGVAGVPGSAFYDEGRGDAQIRFCFAKTARDLEEACRRLKGWRP